MKALNIVLVDDSKTFQEGLIFYLEQILKHKVIETVHTEEDIMKLNQLENIDIILMDGDMPRVNALRAAQPFFRFHNHNIIVLTVFEDRPYLEKLKTSGFMGCVLKRHIYNDLRKALENVMKGKQYFPNV